MMAQIGRLEDVVLVTNSCFAGLPHDRIPSPNFVHLPFDMGATFTLRSSQMTWLTES